MAGQEKWYFTREQLMNSPSRKCGLDADKELAYRQQAANLIQDMGQRLQVSQLCINTAIVYMHRFYAFHSFTQFHRNTIAAAALFLAAKVEEQPRKLEYVIKVSHMCLHRGESVAALDTRSEHYQEQAQDLVFNENVLLQTLGFDVAIDHPHTHVVRTCHLVKAPKDLAQTSYFMASNSLHLTTMCLQYRPTVVACFCIHLASKWSNWAIPQSNEGKHWFFYVDRTVTAELLERLTAEFLHIFDKCPSRLKKRMMNMSNASTSSPQAGLQQASGASSTQAGGSQIHDKKQAAAHARSEQAAAGAAAAAAAAAVDEFDKSFDREYERERRRPQAAGGYVPATSAAPALAAPVPPTSSTVTPAKIDYNAYRDRDKREREDRERRQMSQRSAAPAPRPTSSATPAIAPTSQPGQPSAAAAASSHHQRPQSHHHKPHHSWPHHKPPHHKPPHDHRHHRPSQPVPPNQAASVPSSVSGPPQSVQQELPPAPPPQRTRPPSLFSPENATTPTAAAAAAPRRPQEAPRPPPQRRPPPGHQPQPSAHPHSGHPVHSSHPSHGAAHTEPVATHRPPSSPSHQRKRPPDAGPSAAAAPVVREMQSKLSPMLSPFSSPPPKEPPAASAPAAVNAAHRQHRSRQPAPAPTEPELVPVVKKLDETPGYENVVRDSQRAAARAARRLDASSAGVHALAASASTSGPPPRALNGIETDPTLVSNLLKESLAKPAPITVPTERKSPAPLAYAAPAVPAVPHLSEREIKREHQSEYKSTPSAPPPAPAAAPTAPAPTAAAVEPAGTVAAPGADDVAEHKHKKEKKKKDKHKHKDRDKSKEERKKHKKDKDRERRQESAPPPPPPPRPPADVPPAPFKAAPAPAPAAPAPGALRITIPRDKLSASPGLKIKIPKERLTAPPPPPHHQQNAPPPPAAGAPSSHHHHGQSSGIKIKISKDVLDTSRKRGAPPDTGPSPHKMARHNGAPPPHKVEPHAPPLRNGHAM